MRVPNFFMIATLIVMALAALTVRAEPKEVEVATLDIPVPQESMNGAHQVARPVPSREWDDVTKVWVARSCVGEAGFSAFDECAAIAWVYAKLAREYDVPFIRVVRQYSAAIKYHSMHTRPWIRDLNLSMKRPRDWPNRLKWSVHKVYWEKMLAMLDEWAAGKIPDPTPNAREYGGRMDTPRAKEYRWVKVVTPEGFRNKFWTRPLRRQIVD